MPYGILIVLKINHNWIIWVRLLYSGRKTFIVRRHDLSTLSVQVFSERSNIDITEWLGENK